MARMDIGYYEGRDQAGKNLMPHWCIVLWKEPVKDKPSAIRDYAKFPKLLRDNELMEKKRRQTRVEEGTKTNWQKYYEATILSDKSFTALHFAAKDGQTSIAKSLLEYQANANLTTTEGLTPLHLCANFGHVAIAELLLKYKINVSAVDNNYYKLTPLHYAAENGHREMVELLISNGAKVNASDSKQFMPLHLASKHGHTDIMELLIRKRADVNARCSSGTTPLFGAAMFGHEDAAACLIRNKCSVKIKDKSGMTALEVAVDFGHEKVVSVLIKQKVKLEKALHRAVSTGRKEIAEMLLAGGANVNYVLDDKHLLLTAAYHQKIDLIGTLIRHGADVNFARGAPLFTAVNCGLADVVDEFLKHGVPLKSEDLPENHSMMHVAAQRGFVEVGKILMKHGEDVDGVSTTCKTPLAYAAGNGHKEMVEFLLANGANMNFLTDFGTALHIAATHGNSEIVQLLLEKGALLMAKDKDGKTALELAIGQAHLGVVKVIVNHKKNVLNERASNDWTFLHIATNQNACDPTDRRFELVKLVVAKGANLHTVAHHLKAVHIAAMKGSVEMVEFFLRKGNDINKDYLLHHAVEMSNVRVVKFLIAIGADINAKNPAGETALCIAVRKGLFEVIDLLVKNGANPNIADSKGMTPLHLAVKKAKEENVVLILISGAIYDAKADGKTPAEISENKDISALLALIDMVFKKVSQNNAQVMNELKAIQVPEWVQAILCARNAQGDMLMAAATKANFSKMRELEAFAGGEHKFMDKIDSINAIYLQKREYGKALNTLENSLKERRRKTRKYNDRHTLWLEFEMAKIHELMGGFSKALQLSQDVSRKQKEILGAEAKDTLETRLLTAVALHRLGRNEDAMAIFNEITEIQKRLYGETDEDYINSLFHMALPLHALGRNDEGFAINESVYKYRIKRIDRMHPMMISTRSNYASSLHSVGRTAEAYEMLLEVLEDNKTLYGLYHEDTCLTLMSIAGILAKLGRHEEALAEYWKIIEIQKEIHYKNHPNTLLTLFKLVTTYVALDEFFLAYKVLSNIFKVIQNTFSPTHPIVVCSTETLAQLESVFGHNTSEKSITAAAVKGDLNEVVRLAKQGCANDVDSEGRTALHFATESENFLMVESLLQNGADATIATKKGNTALHTAASKINFQLVQLLLKNVSRKALADFVNAQTSANATTALHVAAKEGSLPIIKLLLKHSAIFNVLNNQGNAPLDLAEDASVREFLQMIQNLFMDIEAGNAESLSKLSKRTQEDIDAITRARSVGGITLYQVALNSGHKEIAQKLLEILKAPTPVADLLEKLSLST